MTSKPNDHLSPDLIRNRATPPGSDPDLDLQWNAHAVQSLITAARRRGETPVVLCLGLRQAAALKAHLSSQFDDRVGSSLKNQLYAGLKVVELKVDSLLRIETLRSIYDSSRHAEQQRIREAMGQIRPGQAPLPPER